MDDTLPLHPWVGLQLQCNFWHFILHTMNGTFLPHDRASDISHGHGAVKFRQICEILRNSQKLTKYREIC